MSVDTRYAEATIRKWGLDQRGVRVLRYAAGSTLAIAVAMGINWQLSFLLPVLLLSFLASPAPRPSLKAGFTFIAIIAFSCLAGLMLGKYLISYPLVYIPFTGLVLLRLFYVKASGKAPLLMTWLLIALLVIPMIIISSPAIARMVAGGILLGAILTICLIWLAHGLIPDRDDVGRQSGKNEAAAAVTPPAPSRSERFHTAAISTLVVLPLFVLFYSFQMISSILILIFVALLSSQPGFATNFKVGGALVIGNAIGGAAAIVFYELLVMVPEFSFLIMLTLLAGLVFGDRVFSDKPTAKLYGMAYSTLLLVIGSVTSGGSGEAGSMVYTRVAQIIIAVVYVVMAFGVADRFVRRKGV
jgi:hypothetical protein